MMIFWILLALVLMLLAVLVLRALFCRAPETAAQPSVEKPDTSAYAEHLSQAIAIPTVSYADPAQTDWEAFRRFHRFLEETYPLVHQHLEKEVVTDYSLFYHWKGQDSSLPPMGLIAHMDVVPIAPGTEGNWQVPPFSGRVQDGFIWGRGAVDMKCQLIAIMETTEALLKEGFRPKQDIYYIFGHNEEVMDANGGGSVAVAALLKERGIMLDSILDEGNFFQKADYLGSDQMAGMICVVEKGYSELALTVRDHGGHAARPPKSSALGQVARVAARLEETTLPLRLTEPLKEQIARLAPGLPFGRRLMLCNLWLFKGIFLRQMAKKAGIPRAMVTTTVAVTMASGSNAPNVLPGEASVIVNVRPLPGGMSLQELVTFIQKMADNPRLEVKVARALPASPIAPCRGEAFERVCRAAKAAMPSAIPVPAIFLGGTDSGFFHQVVKKVYRFSPICPTAEEAAGIHAANEKISLENLEKMLTFFKCYISDMIA